MKRRIVAMIALLCVLMLILSNNTLQAFANEKSILLVYNSSLDTSFDIEIDITATYSEDGWVNVTQISPSIDSNALFMEYSISNNTLLCEVSSDRIKLSGGFTIESYYVLGPLKIKRGTNEYSVSKTFLAKDYIY